MFSVRVTWVIVCCHTCSRSPFDTRDSMQALIAVSTTQRDWVIDIGKVSGLGLQECAMNVAIVSSLRKSDSLMWIFLKTCFFFFLFFSLLSFFLFFHDVWNVNESHKIDPDEQETAKHRKQLVLESENSWRARLTSLNKTALVSLTPLSRNSFSELNSFPLFFVSLLFN